MSQSKNLRSEILELVFQLLKGFFIFLGGLVTFFWHQTLLNPSSETVLLWQSIGGAIIGYAIIETAANTWRISKPKDDRYHDQVMSKLNELSSKLNQLERLETEMSELKAQLAPDILLVNGSSTNGQHDDVSVSKSEEG